MDDEEVDRPLRWGERVLIVRDQDAPPMVVEMPAPLVKGPVWRGTR